MAVNAGQIKYITNGLLILNKSIIPDLKRLIQIQESIILFMTGALITVLFHQTETMK